MIDHDENEDESGKNRRGRSVAVVLFDFFFISHALCCYTAYYSDMKENEQTSWLGKKKK